MERQSLILLLAVCFFGLAVAVPFGCKREMTPKEWRLDGQKDFADRHRSHKGMQMHQTRALIGKSKKGVLDVLGDPDRQEPGGTLIYVLGPDPSFGIDVWELHVEFGSNGLVRATSVEVY